MKDAWLEILVKESNCTLSGYGKQGNIKLKCCCRRLHVHSSVHLHIEKLEQKHTPAHSRSV